MYKIIMMSDQIYLVNKSEYQAIMTAKKGVFIPRLEVYINKASISTAYPERTANDVEDKKLQTGVAHDGTKLKRHFGEWVDASNFVPDDKGDYHPVRLDPSYYPEVAIDNVFTEKEFEKVKHLSNDERKKILIGDYTQERIAGKDNLKSISEIIDDKKGLQSE